MTEKQLPPLDDPQFDRENFDIDNLQDEIRASERTSDLLKHFYLHLVQEKGLSDEEASVLAYGADYFLRDFIIDERRENIFAIPAERIRQFAGNWYIVKNLEPNMQELEGLLAAILFFYQFCSASGHVEPSLPEKIAEHCRNLDYYRRRIEAFWDIEDGGYQAWEKECTLKD
ncbi:MAG: hypothetical protein GWN87_04445 [Desulfuromonadales bacterium]|nr:hypothetical protein [Desulfuromonadales bacterium]NIS39865.1 hypothetical protein [Desulfuromonadales bacterium]